MSQWLDKTCTTKLLSEEYDGSEGKSIYLYVSNAFLILWNLFCRNSQNVYLF